MGETEREEMSDYENSGILSRNDYKKEGSNQTDHKGKLNVEGVEYKLAAWIREGKDGRKFFSLKVQRADEVQQPAAVVDSSVPDDEVPF